MLEILVNEQRLDLAAGEQILFNYSINKIGEIETRQGAQTNDFEVLGSTRNKAILGFSDDINSNTRFPYKLQDCILKENGVDVSIGFLQVVSYNISNNTFDCAFFSSNTEWFEEVKKIDIKNGVDWSDTEHAWSVTGVASNANNTTGFVYPVIDYSESSGATLTPSVNSVGEWYAEQSFVAVYNHTIIQKVFEKINWKLTGDFTKSFMFLNEIIPYSLNQSLNYSSSYIENNKAQAEDTTGATVVITPEFLLPSIIKNPNGELVNGAFTEYTCVNAGNYRVTLDIFITAFSTIPPAPVAVFLELDTGGGYSSAGPISQALGTGTVLPLNSVSSIELFLSAGDKLRLSILASDPLISITYTSALWTIEPFGAIPFGSTIDASCALPEITAEEIIRDLAIRYNLYFQANNYTKTVNVFTYQELKNNVSNPVNWSGKLDMSARHEIDYNEAVENWFKETDFKYQEAEGDSFFIQEFNERNPLPEYGDGVIRIDNDYIESKGTLIESIFYSTFQRDVEGWFIPFVRLIEGTTGVRQYKPGLRILYNRPNTPVENFSPVSTMVVRDNAGTSTTNLNNGSFAYFQKATRNPVLDSLTKNLAFNLSPIIGSFGTSLIEDYYNDFLRIIQDPVLVRASLILKAEDIANLDFSKPVFLPYPFKGCFFVQSIEDYTGAQDVTEVELILIR